MSAASCCPNKSASYHIHKDIAALTEPLRTAQVQAQSGETHRSAELIESLKNAYDSLAQPLKSEQDFKKWVAQKSITGTVTSKTMLTRRANIVQLKSGAFTVHSMPTEPMYTINRVQDTTWNEISN